MGILLVVLFGYNLIGGFAHELIGILLFALFLVHNLLHLRWYRALFKGRYLAYRFAQAIIDILLLAIMITMMVMGILISKEIFRLGLGVDVFVYNLHKGLGYYAFALSSIHLGMHALGWINKANNKIIRLFLLFLPLLFIGALVYSFIDLKLWEYLSFQAGFRFYSDAPIKFYLEMLAYSLGFASLGLYASILLRKASKKGKSKGEMES